jgi:cell division septation protein DedD
MAAQSIPPAPAPTARFVRVYLLIWGLLAVGGLGYLASLAWQPELFAQLGAAEPAETESPLRLANRALTEVGLMRVELGEVQHDVGQVRDAIAERTTQDKQVEARITALEERVASTPAAATPEAPPAEKPTTEKAKPEKPHKPATATTAHAAPRQGPPPGIETGSIASEQPAFAFGEPVVTPAKSATYGVQLAAGPSLDAIRLSWTMLRERHASELAALQPHVVPPRADGTGSYRLVAGPLPSKADADKLCNALGVGRQGCFATTFVGQPL